MMLTQFIANKANSKLASSTLSRSFFQWVNIIFNKVDEERRKVVGPDRSCAEWLLRNGASVKWVNAEDFLTDYNKLPNEEVKFHIQEVDASDSSIMHYGFSHFVGCNHIRKITFHKCYYLEDEALGLLNPLQSTLRNLQVSSCLNISSKGLLHLTGLTNLNQLILFDLPYVKNKDEIVEKLQKGLPKCSVEFK